MKIGWNPGFRRMVLLCASLLALSGTAFGANQEQVYEQARGYLAAGDADAAYALLTQYEGDWSGNDAYDYLLGIAALDSGESGEAIFSLQRLVARRPSFAGARMELARAYYDIGDNELARVEFERVLADNPPEKVQLAAADYLAAIDNNARAYKSDIQYYVELGLGAPTYEVIRAVTADLVDGELDGLQFGSPVAVQGANGVVNLTTDIDFDLEVNRFRNNNATVYEGTPAPVFDFSFFANSGPIANAGADQTVARSTAVTLDGSGSNDPEGAVTYNWVQTSGPSVTLTGGTTVSPTFTAPDTLIGDEVIVLTLTVADAVNTTATDTVTVNIKGALPTTFVIVDQDYYGDNVGEDVDGGGQITLNPDGTGELFVDEGKVLLNYTITGDTFRVTFPNGFIADDFDDFVDDGMGNFVPVIVEEHPDFIEFTLTADLPNKDVLTAVEQGQEIS